MKRYSRIPIYPLLVATYPAIALLAANIGQVRLGAVNRSLFASILGALALYGATWIVSRDTRRAALSTTLLLLMFFSYGHIYELIKGFTLLGIVLGRHRILFPLWAIAATIGFLAVMRGIVPTWWASNLTLPFAIAVGIPLMGIFIFEIQSFAARKLQLGRNLPQILNGQTLPSDGPQPDLYYIILDGFARHDLMRREYGYDSTEFLKKLEDRGFVVARCSQSNYTQTDLSLASSLNFEYLDELYPLPDPDSDNKTGLPPLIQRSKVRKLLEEQGYQTIAFETGFPMSELIDADIYLAHTSSRRSPLGGITGFEELYLRSSAMAILLDGFTVFSDTAIPELNALQDWRRNNILFILESLERLASARGPKFIFAHVVSPHEPFVLGASGEFVYSPASVLVGGRYSDQYIEAYGNQARYLAKRMIGIVDVILSTAGTSPVIIIQADHGPDLGASEDKTKILNAYYFPGALDDVYSTITPVNTFRLVLNSILGADFSLKEDRSYFSNKGDPFDFRLIPSSCGE